MIYRLIKTPANDMTHQDELTGILVRVMVVCSEFAKGEWREGEKMMDKEK